MNTFRRIISISYLSAKSCVPNATRTSASHKREQNNASASFDTRFSMFVTARFRITDLQIIRMLMQNSKIHYLETWKRVFYAMLAAIMHLLITDLNRIRHPILLLILWNTYIKQLQ